MNQALVNRLKERIGPILKEQALELVELSAAYEKGCFILRFFVDKTPSVTLNECAKINRQIGQILESENLVQGRYYLEVSSPGLDRPLTSTKDFERSFGKMVKIVLHQAVDRQNVLQGVACEVSEENIVIKTKNEQKLCVPRRNIARANLEVEF